MDDFPTYSSDLLDGLKLTFRPLAPKDLLSKSDRDLGFYLGQQQLIQFLEGLQERTNQDVFRESSQGEG